MITSATNSTTESRELKLLLFHIKSYPYFNQMSCRWNSHDQKTYIWLRTYRSLIFVPHDSKSGMLLFISSHIEKRTWSQLLSLVPRCKAFALPIKSKRATRISPTKGIYTMMLADDWVQLWLYIINEAYICIHLTRGVPVALFLTDCLKLRSSWIVKTKASRKRLFQYVLSCPPAKDILDDGDTFHYDTLSLRWPHLLKPFTAIMSIGHVFYADVTPGLLFFRFTIYLSSLSSFSSGNESQWSTGGR